MKTKNTLLKTIFGLIMIVCVMVACSDDTDMREMNNENNNVNEAEFAARGSYWEGIIAYDRGNGNYEFAVDPGLLLADLEAELQEMKINTTLVSLKIVERTATNNPNHHGHMLIGGDLDGISIGYMLELENSAFRIVKGLGSYTGISCVGCADGCFLMYFTHADGSSSPYCNEATCSTSDCREVKKKA